MSDGETVLSQKALLILKLMATVAVLSFLIASPMVFSSQDGVKNLQKKFISNESFLIGSIFLANFIYSVLDKIYT